MEIRVIYELQLELKEVTGLLNGSSSCKINIEKYENILDGKEPLNIQLENITSNTKLAITLNFRNRPLGGCQMSLGTLFGDKMLGKVEK